MSARFRKPLIAVLALVITCAGTALAGPRWQQDNRGERNAPHGRMQRPVNEVIGEVENRYGGKVVGVQQQYRDEEMMYRVRVLQRDGRVKTLTVPADRRR